MEWSDGIGHRSRSSWLLLRGPGDRICEFAGESIHGVVAVVGFGYRKAGKWSQTTYRLELAPGVQPIAGLDGWETGRFTEGLRASTNLGTDRWPEVATALGVSVPVAREFLLRWRPSVVEQLDAVDAALEAIDIASEDGAEEISVSFGGPTNRAIAAGFWDLPVVVCDGEREVGRVEPHPDYGWDSPAAQGCIRILDVIRVAGYHGGYVSLRLAAPAGTRARHGVATQGRRVNR